MCVCTHRLRQKDKQIIARHRLRSAFEPKVYRALLKTMPRLISHSCQANKDVVCRFASCQSGSQLSLVVDHHRIIHSDPLWSSLPLTDLIRANMLMLELCRPDRPTQCQGLGLGNIWDSSSPKVYWEPIFCRPFLHICTRFIWYGESYNRGG